MNDPAEQISPPIRIRLLVDEDDEIRQVNEIYNEAVKIKCQ